MSLPGFTTFTFCKIKKSQRKLSYRISPRLGHGLLGLHAISLLLDALKAVCPLRVVMRTRLVHLRCRSSEADAGVGPNQRLEVVLERDDTCSGADQDNLE